MEENFSDTEHISKHHIIILEEAGYSSIVAGKKHDKFQQTVRKLRVLIFVLMLSGLGISKESLFWFHQESSYFWFHDME